MATAGMPSAFARSISGPSLMAPSRSEYWVWRWRCVNGRGIPYSRPPVISRPSGAGSLAGFARLVEDALHGAQRLHELELLAFRALAVDQRPAVRTACRDAVAVRLERRRSSLRLGRHRDHAVGSHLRHPAPRR